MNKRLYKSCTDKKLEGVCAGIANYFNIDPTLVRAGFALITLFSAGVPGIIAYIVLAAIMPVEPCDQMPPQ
ncbi:MAG: PspC domain-containing protein [Clostridiales bacterium]|nr:PspC domain-containing protein [Clostridiales bacterium]